MWSVILNSEFSKKITKVSRNIYIEFDYHIYQMDALVLIHYSLTMSKNNMDLLAARKKCACVFYFYYIYLNIDI